MTRRTTLALLSRIDKVERALGNNPPTRLTIKTCPVVETAIVTKAVELALRGDAIMLRYIINRFRLAPPPPTE